MLNLVESKKIIVEEIEEFKEVISGIEDNQKARIRQISKEQENIDYPLEEIDNKREDLRWKKGLNYYLLNPQKFDFRLKDL